jgi:hypothetical protein
MDPKWESLSKPTLEELQQRLQETLYRATKALQESDVVWLLWMHRICVFAAQTSTACLLPLRLFWTIR